MPQPRRLRCLRRTPSPPTPPDTQTCELDYWFDPARITKDYALQLNVLQLDQSDRTVLRVADERDAVQKKTFTKWMNQHLTKAQCRIIDLFQDLRDGNSLITLLEVLSQEHLPREKGRMRFHKLQNINIALNFLNAKQIKIVNIRPDEITDGNPKLTLGLIWTIILHFQVSDIVIQDQGNLSARDALLVWSKRHVDHIPRVKITNFTTSWRDGLAFLAILNRHRPELVDMVIAENSTARDNLNKAFALFDKEYNVTQLLEAADIDVEKPDEKSVITYVSSLYDIFPFVPVLEDKTNENEKLASKKEYQQLINDLELWLQSSTASMDSRANLPNKLVEMRTVYSEFESFGQVEVPPRFNAKEKLAAIHCRLVDLNVSEEEINVGANLTLASLNSKWDDFVEAMRQKDVFIRTQLSRMERLQRMAETLHVDCKSGEAMLMNIKRNMSNPDASVITSNQKATLNDSLVGMHNIVSQLRLARYHQTEILAKRVRELADAARKIGIQGTSLTNKNVGDETREVAIKNTVVSGVLQSTRLNGVGDLNDAIQWCQTTRDQLQRSNFGVDLASLKVEQRLHESTVHQEILGYADHIAELKKATKNANNKDADLISKIENNYLHVKELSIERLEQLNSAARFVESASDLIEWMHATEDVNTSRVWSAPDLNIITVKQYYQKLMSELASKDTLRVKILEQGALLVRKGHPMIAPINDYISTLNTNWEWLVQLTTICMDNHLPAVTQYRQFYTDVGEISLWIKSRHDLVSLMDSRRSLSNELKELKDDISEKEIHVNALSKESLTMRPVDFQMETSMSSEVKVVAICSYQDNDVKIEKGDICVLLDTSEVTRWTVVTTGESTIQDKTFKPSSGLQLRAPSLCFEMPPPSRTAIETADKLSNDLYDLRGRVTAFDVQQRQRELHTIANTVLNWKVNEISELPEEQRISLLSHINSEHDYIISECKDAAIVADLVAKVKAVNHHYADLVNTNKELGLGAPNLMAKLQAVELSLGELDKELVNCIKEPITCSNQSQDLAILIKDQENRSAMLVSLTPNMNSIKSDFQRLADPTPQLDDKLSMVVEKWNHISFLTRHYSQRLANVQSLQNCITEVRDLVVELETSLSLHDKLSSNTDEIKVTVGELQKLVNSLQVYQHEVDELNVAMTSLSSDPGDLSTTVKLRDQAEALLTRWLRLIQITPRRLEQAIACLDNLQACHVLLENSNGWMNNAEQLLENGNEVDGIKESGENLEKANQLGGSYMKECQINVLEQQSDQLSSQLEEASIWITEVTGQLRLQPQMQEELVQVMTQMDGHKSLMDGVFKRLEVMDVLCKDVDSLYRVVCSANDSETKEQGHIGDLMDLLLSQAEDLKLRAAQVSGDHKDILSECENRLKNFYSVSGELGKLANELSDFAEWLENTRAQFDFNKEQPCNPQLIDKQKLLSEDVVSHKADLRFVNMTAQRFLSSCHKFNAEIEKFATSRQCDANSARNSLILTCDIMTYSVTKERLAAASTAYDRLVVGCNSLDCSLEQQSKLHLDTKATLATIQASIQGNSSKIEELLKTLSQECSPEDLKKKINDAQNLSAQLLDNITTLKSAKNDSKHLQAMPGMSEDNFDDKESKLTELRGKLSEFCDRTRVSLVEAQSELDARQDLQRWLQDAQQKVDVLENTSLPLNGELLSDLQKKVVLFKIAVKDHESSFERLPSADESLSTRYRRICSRIDAVDSCVEDLVQRLRGANDVKQELESWSGTGLQYLKSDHELNPVHSDKIKDLKNSISSKMEKLEELKKMSKYLIEHPNTIEVKTFKDSMFTTEKDVSELLSNVEKAETAIQERLHMKAEFTSLKEDILDWLSSHEILISEMDVVAISVDEVQKQIDLLNPIVTSYEDFSEKLTQLNNVANSLHIKPQPKKPKKTPSKSSTDRYPSITDSNDNGILDLSSDSLVFESSDVDQGVIGVLNSRYDEIGEVLIGRQNDLDTTLEQSAVVDQLMASTKSFVKREEKKLKDLCKPLSPDQQMAQNTPEGKQEWLQSMIDQHKKRHEDMLKEESCITFLEKKTSSLLESHDSKAVGASELRKMTRQLDDHWDICKQLSIEKIKNLTKTLKEERSIALQHQQLSEWLSNKHKMIRILATATLIQPPLILNQIEQVALLRDEMRKQQPVYESFIESTMNYTERCLQPIADDHLISQMDHITKQWNCLENKLTDKESLLNETYTTCTSFKKSVKSSGEWMAAIEDDFSAIPAIDKYSNQSNSIVKDHYQIIKSKLSARRDEIDLAKKLCGELCSYVKGSDSENELDSKLKAIETAYFGAIERCNKGLQMVKSADSESLRFSDDLSAHQDTVSDLEHQIQQFSAISADEGPLRIQARQFQNIAKLSEAKMSEIKPWLQTSLELLDKSIGDSKHLDLKESLSKLYAKCTDVERQVDDRSSRFKTAEECCTTFTRCTRDMLSWLQINEIQPCKLELNALAIERKIQDTHSLQTDIVAKQIDINSLKDASCNFIDATDTDHPLVSQLLQKIVSKFEAMIITVGELQENYESVLQKVSEFEDSLHTVNSLIQQIDSRVIDDNNLANVKPLKHEISVLPSRLEYLSKLAEDLLDQEQRCSCEQFSFCNSDSVQSAYLDCRSKANRAVDNAQHAIEQVQIREKMFESLQVKYQEVKSDFVDIETEISELPLLFCDRDALSNEMYKVQDYMENIKIRSDNIHEVQYAIEEISEISPLNSDREETYNNYIHSLKSLSDGIHDKVESCEKTLLQRSEELEGFHKEVEGKLDEIRQLTIDIECLPEASNDQDIIVQQQKELNAMKTDKLEPLQHQIQMLTSEANSLISTSPKNSPTDEVDCAVAKLNQCNSTFKEKLANKISDLDCVLLTSGKYNSSFSIITQWLDDTEEIIRNQKSPSLELKVIQAQISEQMAVSRLMKDRLTLVDTAFDMGRQLSDTDNVTALSSRWNRCLRDIEQREHDLERTERSAQMFHDRLKPLQLWLEQTDSLHTDAAIQPPAEPEAIRAACSKHGEIIAELSNKKSEIDDLRNLGSQLINLENATDQHIVRDKLNSIEDQFNDLLSKSKDHLEQLSLAEPMCSLFNDCHDQFKSLVAEYNQVNADPNNHDKIKLYQDIANRGEGIFNEMETCGLKLKSLTSSRANIDSKLDNCKVKMDDISETLTNETLYLENAKQKSDELIHNLNELLDWFKYKDDVIPLLSSVDQHILLHQLSEHKIINDEIISQKTKVRDLFVAAKRLKRELQIFESDEKQINEISDCLKSYSEDFAKNSAERLNILEQSHPFALHYSEMYEIIANWVKNIEIVLNDIDNQSDNATSLQQMKSLQEIYNIQKQNVVDQKPNMDRLNKAAFGLILLLVKHSDDDGVMKNDLELELNSINSVYEQLRSRIRSMCMQLADNIQHNADLSDQIEHLSDAFTDTYDQLQKNKDISPYSLKLREQITENKLIEEDMIQREQLFLSIIQQANDCNSKNEEVDQTEDEDTVYNDIQNKVVELKKLYDNIAEATTCQGRDLETTFTVADEFWSNYDVTSATLEHIQGRLDDEEPPSVEHDCLIRQQHTLATIIEEIEDVDSDVKKVSETGDQLLKLIAPSETPEIQKTLDDMNCNLDNLISNSGIRQKRLTEAQLKSEKFKSELNSMLEWLSDSEMKLNNLATVASTSDQIESQINELEQLKTDIHPHHEHIAVLNHSGQLLIREHCLLNDNVHFYVQQPLIKVNMRWNQLLGGVVNRKSKLQVALLSLGQLHIATRELMNWLDATAGTLSDFDLIPLGDQRAIEIDLAKLNIISKDLECHDIGRQSLRDFSKEQHCSDNLDDLDCKWQNLCADIKSIHCKLEGALKESKDYEADIDEAMIIVDDLLGQLEAFTSVGGLPETARNQLARFMDLLDEVAKQDVNISKLLERGAAILESNPRSSRNEKGRGLHHDIELLRNTWLKVTTKANEKKKQLDDSMSQANKFDEKLNNFIGWINSMENTLNNMEQPSRILCNVEVQMKSQTELQKSIVDELPQLNNLQEIAGHLKYYAQKQDLILIRNLTVNAEKKWQKLLSKTAQRSRKLQNCFHEAKQFSDCHSSFLKWLNDNQSEVDNNLLIASEPTNIRQQILKHREFQRLVGSKQSTLDHINKLGRHLKDRCRSSDLETIQEMLKEIKRPWNDICTKSVDRQRRLEEALLFSGQLADAIKALLDWLYGAELQLTGDDSDGGGVLLAGDLDTVNNLLEQYKSFEIEFEKRRANLETVRKVADDINTPDNETPSTNRVGLQTQLVELSAKWDKVESLAAARKLALEAALSESEEFNNKSQSLLEWLAGSERLLRFQGSLPDDPIQVEQQILEHSNFLSDLEAQKTLLNSTLKLGNDILTRCHPDAVATVKHWTTILQCRWKEVVEWSNNREEKLRETLANLEGREKLLNDSWTWICEVEAGLLKQQNIDIPENLPIIEQLLNDHQTLGVNIQCQQTDIDCLTKNSKRDVSNSAENLLAANSANPMRRQKKPISSRYAQKKEHIAKPSEVSFKNTKLNNLLTKWKNIWVMYLERKNVLEDALNNVLEIESMKNFKYDIWKGKYMRWMNGNKIRAMDFFRRMDRDHDGKITTKEFIEGILSSKFPTTTRELEAVAGLFEKNKQIDYKQFIASLRSDKEAEKQNPEPDAVRIQDEVKRLASKCTCDNQFKIHKVGEGKYKQTNPVWIMNFGESQKLRLVRILSSTVMVRVGGGWLTLDEFLVKNDPCRAKGRTNVELKEHFVLANGVAQSMTPFRSKMSATGASSSTSWSAGGYTSSSVNSTPQSKTRTGIQTPSRCSPAGTSRLSNDTNQNLGNNHTPKRCNHSSKNNNVDVSTNVSCETNRNMTTVTHETNFTRQETPKSTTRIPTFKGIHKNK